MSSSSDPDKGDTSRQARSTKQYAFPTLQPPDENPWLSRAAYFLRGGDLETLTPRWHEESSLRIPDRELFAPTKPAYFSRAFLSKFLGGSRMIAYANVMDSSDHIYHLPSYYVGAPEWTPQFPKAPGEHGALLSIGTSTLIPGVPWSCVKGDNPKPIVNCFAKSASAEYEYIGRYVFHPEFRKLNKQEVEKYVPKAAWDLWTKGIDKSNWGKTLKCKLAKTNVDVGDDDETSGTSASKTAEELFKKPDGDPSKLCFYWQYIECIGYDAALYTALCTKGQEVGWATRELTVSQGQTKTQEAKEEPGEPGLKMEYTDRSQSTLRISRDDEPEVQKNQPKVKSEPTEPKVKMESEEPKFKIEPEDLDQKLVKGSPPEKKARF